MAPHSSTPAWKILWMEEPGRLRSMGSLGVGHDCMTSLSLFTFMHWRRKWQPTPVFLPGESQGWGSLVGCCLWGPTESDTSEATQQQQHIYTYICMHSNHFAIHLKYCESTLLEFKKYPPKKLVATKEAQVIESKGQKSRRKSNQKELFNCYQS